MKVRFAPVFNRKNKLNSKGLAPIEIRAYQDRKRKFFSTSISIAPFQWDEKHLEIKKHPQAELLNFQIRELISQLETTQVEHQIKNKSYSIESVSGVNKGVKNGSFVAFMRDEIEKNRVLSSKTKTGHKNTINKLMEFTKNKDILFSDISYAFVDDFMNHLRDHKLANNTVQKQHKNLKKWIDLAIKKGFYEQSNPCKDIKIRYEQKKREVLSIKEMDSIENLDLSGYDDKVGIVRDMFLFACYCGLRISDVVNCKVDYLKKEKDGYALDFKTIKVNKRAQIPLYSLFPKENSKKTRPEIIIDTYLDKKNEFLFPRITEPLINRHLKVIGMEAQIPFNLTFHVARHTFGTYMATKIPLPYLMFLMQHSDIKTTMGYVNTSHELVKQGLLKVDWE